MTRLALVLLLGAATRPAAAQAAFDAAAWLARARASEADAGFDDALLDELDAATGWVRACAPDGDAPDLDPTIGSGEPAAPFAVQDMTPARWGTLVSVACDGVGDGALDGTAVFVHVLGAEAAVVSAQRVRLDGTEDGPPARVFGSTPLVSPLRRTFEIFERIDGTDRPAADLCGRVHKFAVTGLGTTRLVQAVGIPCNPNEADVLDWPWIYPAD